MAWLQVFVRFGRLDMKTLLSLLLSLTLLNASATGYDPVTISGNSSQIVILSGSSVTNTTTGNQNVSQQNLASNTGGVEINGESVQIVAAYGSIIRNEVEGGDSYASQNFSSNVGAVSIGGSLQVTALLGSYAYNSASGHQTYAVQNVASNNACMVCVNGRCSFSR
jgi:hypothetical protein